MSLARTAYNALVRALLPAALVRLIWRSRREAGYREHIPERFGRYARTLPREPLVWVHAVSVGETRAAEPLVRALMKRYPQHRVLITHMTPTGRRTGQSLFGERVMRAYLPYDFPGAVNRFLDHYRPRTGVLLETEVWPNLVHACRARGIPLYLANARLSAKSLRGYLRLARLARETFGALTAVAAQSAGDAERLRSLGAVNVHVTGNLKFDVSPPPEQLELGRAWRAAFGARAVLVAASTREGEEGLLLDAIAAFPEDMLLLIVPRHPQRFDEVASMLGSRGIAYQRRSTDEPISPRTRVLIGDSMGEMFAYYACCDLAFIGGSLRPFGGQNLIEACAVGKPVLFGPSMYNFTEAATDAISAGAALRIENAEELARKTSALLSDRATLERMSQAALEFSRAHRGATDKLMSLLKISD